MERSRVWRGRVAAGRTADHEQHSAWLATDEAAAQFAKYLLTGYRLEQRGEEIAITMSATEPPAIIRFLRFDRMWPDFWEHQSTDPLEGPGLRVLVSWRRAGS
ncbi:MAG: hypothetical protein U0821_08360 [Chloroflexota bacterium]